MESTLSAAEGLSTGFGFWIGRKQRTAETQRRLMRKKFTGRALSAVHSALCLLGAMLFALSIPAHAQQPKKIPRIGILSPESGDPLRIAPRGTDAFRQDLHELGWVDGENIVLEYRWANENEDRLPMLAAELLSMNIDIIVATSVNGARAAQRLTKTTPIVAIVMSDPVGMGLVKSLGQPAGNLTGLSIMGPELAGKRLELLKELTPRISRVAVLANVGNVDRETSIKEIESVARSSSVQLQILNVKKPDEIENAFAAMVREKAAALTVLTQNIFFRNRTRIVELAAKSRMPTMYPRGGYVEAGGLISYGPDRRAYHRRAAYFVDRILRGAKPADLPVEQPTKFELVINLKTARALERKIPAHLLMEADRVIE